MSRMPRHLMEHPEDVSIVRLPGGELPSFDWAAGPFASLTRTPDETSVVCLSSVVPKGSTAEGPFRVVEVAGPRLGRWCAVDVEHLGLLDAVQPEEAHPVGPMAPALDVPLPVEVDDAHQVDVALGRLVAGGHVVGDVHASATGEGASVVSSVHTWLGQ